MFLVRINGNVALKKKSRNKNENSYFAERCRAKQLRHYNPLLRARLFIIYFLETILMRRRSKVALGRLDTPISPFLDVITCSSILRIKHRRLESFYLHTQVIENRFQYSVSNKLKYFISDILTCIFVQKVRE